MALAQRFVALGVEIGVRLVQNDQERVAVKRARKRNALGLPGRQRGAAFADLGLVAFRQPDDQIVHARRGRRRDHRLGVHGFSEAPDVLRHGAGEQLDVLRQVTDVLAERFGRPLVERCAIEADAAPRRLTRRRPSAAPASSFLSRSGR